MSFRSAFVVSLLVSAFALVVATLMGKSADETANAAPPWQTTHIAASAERGEYWMAFLALSGRSAFSARDTVARVEFVCRPDSGARLLVGPLPDKPLSDTARGQASYFTTVRAHVVSTRPFFRWRSPAATLDGDWPYRVLNNNAGFALARSGPPVRRLARAFRDDRTLVFEFAGGRRYVFPLIGADTAATSVLGRCADLSLSGLP